MSLSLLNLEKPRPNTFEFTDETWYLEPMKIPVAMANASNRGKKMYF
jgi:hypothetical protein